MSTIDDSTLATDRTSSLDDTDKIIIMKQSDEMSGTPPSHMSHESTSDSMQISGTRTQSPLTEVFSRTMGKVRSTLFGSASKQNSPDRRPSHSQNPTPGPSGDSYNQPTPRRSSSPVTSESSTAQRPYELQGARSKHCPVIPESTENERFADEVVDAPGTTHCPAPLIKGTRDINKSARGEIITGDHDTIKSTRDLGGPSQQMRGATERNPNFNRRSPAITHEHSAGRFTVAPVSYTDNPSPRSQRESFRRLPECQRNIEDDDNMYDLGMVGNNGRRNVHFTPTVTANHNDVPGLSFSNSPSSSNDMYRQRDNEAYLNHNLSDNLHPHRHDGKRNHSRPLVMPDRFNGITSWEDYRSHFQYCSLLNGWNSEQKGQFLAALLSGPAQKVLKRVENSGDVTYSRLVQQLDNQYGTRGQAEKFLFQLQSRRRRRDESLAEFGNSILELTEQAYPELDSTAVDRLARQYFETAITDPMLRMDLHRAQPKSMNDAIRTAISLEAYFLAEDDRTNRRRPLSRRVEINEDCDAVNNRSVRHVGNELTSTNRSNNRRNDWSDEKVKRYQRGECFLCGEKGHMRRVCPHRRERGNDDRPNVRGSVRSDSASQPRPTNL